ncbi:MAG: hypothetical protein OXU68_14390 [Bacteroidota bacterium]|nr:hypothetical protein [Bacteroidota bacterium]MDE2958177.1 hypothetical protein [Bacteroidota bacterium]
MTSSAFDVTPFLDQQEGQHYERKSLFHGESGSTRIIHEDSESPGICTKD